MVRLADGAEALDAAQGGVRDAAVLGHAVDLGDRQAEARVPAQQLGRHRRGAAGGVGAGIEAERAQDLLRDEAAHDRDAQQPLQLRRRHLRVDRLLELDPQARHREEHRRPRPLQVGGEGLEALGEEHVHPGGQQRMLDQGALGDVRQRQVAQQPRAAVERHALQAGVDRPGEGREAVHHALGHAGRARGVHEGRELVAVAHRRIGQRRRRGDDRVPLRIVVRRGERQADAGQARRNAGAHRLPAVELADEQQLRLGVLEDLPDRAGGERRIERHRDVAGHPDREVGEQPVGAVLGKDGDPAARRKAERAQVRGHAPHLADRLAPGEIADRAAALRLGQDDLAGRRLLPVVEALQRELLGSDRVAGRRVRHGGLLRARTGEPWPHASSAPGPRQERDYGDRAPRKG